MQQLKRRWCYSVAVVLISMLGLGSAAAVGRTDIAIVPSSTATTIAPGDSKRLTMTVLNEGATTYSVTFSSAPYSVHGEDYTPSFTPLPGKTNVAQWVHLDTSGSKQLTPRSIENIGYTISVPAGTPAGGYYAVVFARTETSASGAGVRSISRVGNILYITVAGHITSGGAVHADHIPGFTTHAQLPLGVEVSNTGGTHFVNTTKLLAKNVLGQTVFNAHVEHYVLPQTRRHITSKWTTPPFGLFRITGTSTVPGKTVQLSSHWILVVHMRVLLVILAIAALIVAYCVIRLRLRRRRLARMGA